MNDGYLFFWQSVAMLDTSRGRFPGSEKGRLLLYEKFSVFRYHTSEQSCIVLANVKKSFKVVFFQHFVGNSFISHFAP